MTDKIKLLMISHNYPRYSGDFAGIFIALLAKKLLQYGIQPVILAPHDKDSKEYEINDGVIIYRFRYADNDEDENIAYRGNMHKLVLGSVSGIFKFKNFLDCNRKAAFEIIEKENIEIVAGHWLIPSGIVMKSIAKKKNLPMIMSSHGTDIRLMRKYFKVVYRYLNDFCLNLKSWTVVSKFLKKGIVELDGQLEKIIKVLPLPHDETIFFRNENIERKNNLIVANTRFTHQKRVDVLIRAFALVTEKKDDAKLHIYKMGDNNQEIIDLIEKLGLTDKITIFDTVPQSELQKIYNSATMVVLNSVDEGFGLTLSEAMLCGAAVIGTDSGGITDIIKHETTGLLVEPDNHNNLADAILTLLNNNILREKLAENGYKFACENFSSNGPAEKYSQIVKSAMKQ